MSATPEKIEEELRSEIYTLLVELAFANTEQKASIAARLSDACGKLHDLIVHGRIPET